MSEKQRLEKLYHSSKYMQLTMSKYSKQDQKLAAKRKREMYPKTEINKQQCLLSKFEAALLTSSSTDFANVLEWKLTDSNTCERNCPCKGQPKCFQTKDPGLLHFEFTNMHVYSKDL